ncbi:HupE/UreJ family protein [Shewanella sp. GXUN23E]|uniref:HupE/UreJ family protein n=1 Tax=Shewanella sp. GXUN23E TaxID=3422498 RepID=UPI003D7D671A
MSNVRIGLLGGSALLGLLMAAAAVMADSAVFSAEVEQGVRAGLVHQISGVVHLVMMLAIGIWAWQLGRNAWFWLPIGVIAALVLGSLLGRNAMAQTLCQAGTILSVLMLGAMIAGNVRWPVMVSLTLVSVLSLFHGYGHGLEYADPNGFMAYIAGIVIASVLAMYCGTGLAMLLDITHRRRNRELLGALTLLSGAAMVWLA